MACSRHFMLGLLVLFGLILLSVEFAPTDGSIHALTGGQIREPAEEEEPKEIKGFKCSRDDCSDDCNTGPFGCRHDPLDPNVCQKNVRNPSTKCEAAVGLAVKHKQCTTINVQPQKFCIEFYSDECDPDKAAACGSTPFDGCGLQKCCDLNGDGKCN